MSLRNVVRVQVDAPKSTQIILPDINLLPKAPGNNWSDTAFQGNHSKKQVLANEFRGNFGKDYKPTNVRDGVDKLVPATCEKLYNCIAGKTSMQNVQRVPSEVVLSFQAYSKEGVVESAQEVERIHRVLIQYHAIDDTIYILEKAENSGMPTGPVLKRQCVPHPDKSLGRNITASDLNIGVSIEIYGRVYRIVNVDPLTRQYVGEVLGLHVPEPEEYPVDQYAEYRTTKVQPPRKARTYEDQDMRLVLEQQTKGRVITNYPSDVQRVKRFLSDSDKVLRFYAAWDDRDQPHGDVRNFEVRYYVQDDTVVVAERLPPNAGRDGGKVFCSRRRCPKPEFQCKGSDLTFSHRVNGIRSEYHGDDAEKVYYNVHDLQIGKTINIFGRNLLLYDCDPYTRQFYTIMGVDLAASFSPPENVSHRPKLITTVLPPYNGYGSEEDSAAACGSLLLKGPKRDQTKWIAMDGKVLRFKMKFYNPPIAEDRIREFVMSFNLADDIVSIIECAIPNTGFLGGKVLRQKVKKYDGETAQAYYGPSDFQVGVPLQINGMEFIIVSMDKFTEDYYKLATSLERKVEINPKDLKRLLDRLRLAVDAKFITVTEAFRKWDTDHDGFITTAELQEVIQTLNMRCLEEEIAAIVALFDAGRTGRFSFQQFMAIMNNLNPSVALAKVPDPHEVTKYVQTCKVQSEKKDACKLRLQTLRLLNEKLNERKLNGFEMFRMISTIPGGPQGTASAVITPQQLRVALTEVLELNLTRDAQEVLIEYFFPSIPSGSGDRDVSGDPRLRMDLANFHRALVEMGNIGMLPPKGK